ncbi:MAG: hypothetical protein NTW10_13900 [Bacteroidetes bacterium]|nr:hypothetical protein [Bacteroidota bacterium]
MKIVSLLFGILAFFGMLVGLIPCIGALNWLNIPFAGLGFIISIIALTTGDPKEPKGNAVSGLILCGIAVFIGVIRLLLGGGVL